MKLSQAYQRCVTEYGAFRWRPRTIQSYGKCIKRTIDIIGDKDVAELTTVDFGKLRAEIAKKAATANGYRAYFIALRSVLRFCRLVDVPCFSYEKVIIPKEENTRRSFLTTTEVARMLESSNSLENKLLVSLLFSSGVRSSEAMSLNRDQIVDRRMTIIGKGGKERSGRIDKGTEKILNEYLKTRTDDSPALFVDRYNKRLTTNGAYSRIRTVRHRAGIGKAVGPHTLRRSCATDMLKNGADIVTVAEHLGHSNIATTRRYLHIDDPYMNKEYAKWHTDVEKLLRKKLKKSK